MCNRYNPDSPESIYAHWGLRSLHTWKRGIGPFGVGPFIRMKAGAPDLVVGLWALIGDSDTQAINRPRMTNNARWGTISKLKTYRGPWARGQRCVIPAVSYDEPNWETNKNVWWTLRRADRKPWHLAGIWNTWRDPDTGEIFESYSMVTDNCDAHPFLRRFHKPDPSLPVGQQDKRSVIPIEEADLQVWLAGTVEEASALIRLPAEGVFDAGPSVPDRPPVSGSPP